MLNVTHIGLRFEVDNGTPLVFSSLLANIWLHIVKKAALGSDERYLNFNWLAGWLAGRLVGWGRGGGGGVGGWGGVAGWGVGWGGGGEGGTGAGEKKGGLGWNGTGR